MALDWGTSVFHRQHFLLFNWYRAISSGIIWSRCEANHSSRVDVEIRGAVRKVLTQCRLWCLVSVVVRLVTSQFLSRLKVVWMLFLQ